MNNNENCEYDGGDVCECTCTDGDYYRCGVVGYPCVDPTGPVDVFYNCNIPLMVVPTCEAESQMNWIEENTFDAQALREALICSGGFFYVTWLGHVIISEAICVLNGAILNITGVGLVATIAGASESRLFTVVNASLHLVLLA